MADIDQKIYEEVGANYRFFLGWRHAAFAGYLIMVGAAVALSVSTFKDSPLLAFLFPLGACPVGILLWVIDVRNRKLYSMVQRAGVALEVQTPGCYTKIDQVAFAESESPWSIFWGKKQLTHSLALNFLFLGGSIFLLLLTLWLKFYAAESQDPKVALQRALDFTPSFHKQPSPVWIFQSMTFDTTKKSYEIVVLEENSNTKCLVATDASDKVVKAQRLP